MAYALREAFGDQLGVTFSDAGRWPAQSVADVVVVLGGLAGDARCSPECVAAVDAVLARGGGVVLAADALGGAEGDPLMARWCNGYAVSWSAERPAIRVSGLLDHCAVGHPVLRGVGGGSLRGESYRRVELVPGAIPLIVQRALPGTARDQIAAWCCELPDGGRGFATCMGTSLESLRHDGLRTLLLNAIAWSARLEVPDSGVPSRFVEREDVDAALGSSVPLGPIRVAVLAGNAAHRWHNWPETTAALLSAWNDDGRISARVHTDPDDLVSALGDRDVLVQNWVNWSDPKGLSAGARAAILAFLQRGGGLYVHHFANGACHPSLHGAAGGDWPEYRRIVRRVWEHRALGPGPSGHDAFGAFGVVPRGDHPLVADLEPFSVHDELYWRQHGDEPITPLLTARAHETGADEPLLWAYEYGSARVVQCLLGHSAKTYEVAAMRVLARRIVAWCARRAIHGSAHGP